LPEETRDFVRTPLYGRHLSLGARMVPFAGWMMPVQYRGILHEHRTVRSNAGLFDLGHMGQIEIRGKDATEFLQFVTTNDVTVLDAWQAQYSLLTNEGGGVVDDIVVYRQGDGDGYFVVVNASNRGKDVEWLTRWAKRRCDLDVHVEDISDHVGMIAVQGPLSESIVGSLVSDSIHNLRYFAWAKNRLDGVRLNIARTGYTGEDGFELYSNISDIDALWDRLLEAGQSSGLEPIGLGARDTLRLEARMPLYGNELDDSITPLEAGLGWAVRFEKGDFIGRQALITMKSAGIPRKIVGFKLTERSGSARPQAELRVGGAVVGQVTSGAYSPTLEQNIGLGLVDTESAGVGKPLEVMVRDRSIAAVQVKTPFYKRPAREN
jgi:aminomethyltransferase